MHRLVQVPFKKEALSIEEEEGNTKGVDQDNGPESGGIVDELPKRMPRPMPMSHDTRMVLLAVPR